ncbi:hypothetical protein RJ641_015258 [Dillenia turbinata]|uniref:Uncharacterized protein n=1 Tax=Dillenia turbinata TaxID=194707 RepID=A0AAN8UUE5_9MAGN
MAFLLLLNERCNSSYLKGLIPVHYSMRGNGLVCKNPMLVQAVDFSFNGLHLQGNTSNSRPRPCS